jgi:hypothetical protein
MSGVCDHQSRLWRVALQETPESNYKNASTISILVRVVTATKSLTGRYEAEKYQLSC